jgi:20S proteasome alpha/beta subunit
MTIALGVLAKDGVVLAADTELTWGYLKTSGEKIWTTEAKAGALAIAGAGLGGYLEAVSQQLIDDFQSLHKPIASEQIKKRFEKILAAFHKAHVMPYGEAASIWFLIALQHGKETDLWATHSGVIWRRTPYATVGLGCEYADALLGKILRARLVPGVPLAERIAAYAVFDTKNNVQNCGKKTSLVALQGGRVIETNASKMMLLDSYCDRCADVQTLGTRYALGFPYKDQGKASENMTRYFAGLRRDMVAVDNLSFEGKEADLE